MPQKTKSGSERLEHIPYNTLRRIASNLGIKFHHQTKDELIEQVRNKQNSTQNDQDPIQIIEEIRNHVNDRLDKLEESVKSYNGGVSYEDFREDIEKVARDLGINV